jgi:hypothetical protein
MGETYRREARDREKSFAAGIDALVGGRAAASGQPARAVFRFEDGEESSRPTAAARNHHHQCLLAPAIVKADAPIASIAQLSAGARPRASPTTASISILRCRQSAIAAALGACRGPPLARPPSTA